MFICKGEKLNFCKLVPYPSVCFLQLTSTRLIKYDEKHAKLEICINKTVLICPQFVFIKISALPKAIN